MKTDLEIQTENISGLIYFIRGEKVVLDFDLAIRYEVQTKNLNLAVKRNISRFPPDFMFRLTKSEWNSLRLQIATSNSKGGTRYLPYAFTEQGVAMLSGILNSDRAVQVNIAIMRAFVQLRKFLETNKELALKIEALESTVSGHDESIHLIFETIRALMEKKNEPREPIGFNSPPPYQ